MDSFNKIPESVFHNAVDDSANENIIQPDEFKLCGNAKNNDFKLHLGKSETPLHLQLTKDGWFFMAKKTKDPDLPHWDEAMKDYPHLDEWLKAVHEEMNTLEGEGCWVECLKLEAKKAGQKIIPCQWVLRVKRSPSGEILKFEGRIVLQGDLMDQQEENFSSICAFSAV